MKKFISFKLALFLAFTSTTVLAHHHDDAHHPADFGSSLYASAPDGWYDISTESYPIAAPLSRDRNRGVSSGSVFLTPEGFTLGEAGDYYVDFTAVLTNPDELSSLIIPVFVSVRGQDQSDETEIDPMEPNPIAGVGVITAENFTSVQGHGTLKNVPAGSRISLIITNAGYPEPQLVKVISWNISVHKLN